MFCFDNSPLFGNIIYDKIAIVGIGVFLIGSLALLWFMSGKEAQ